MVPVFWIILFIAACEAALILSVRFLRKEFQWLITEEDELPKFDAAALKKYFEGSFYPPLGWQKKAGSSGREKCRDSESKFTIDSSGARANSGNYTDATIACFGDSYTFCRQVEDDQTWEVYLSRRLNTGVMNFGCGNYGLDQSLLRYEETRLPECVQTVIFGVVPETICRIHSYWKHYCEFGNTFAFKPRFTLEAGNLKLIPSAIQSPEDFNRIPQKIDEIRSRDFFYATKFRNYQFRFPYTLSFFRAPVRNLRIIGALLKRRFLKGLKKNTPFSEHAPFALIMEDNVRLAYKLYQRRESLELFEAIVRRIAESAKKMGQKPILLIMPQLTDLKLQKECGRPYEAFFERLKKTIEVWDVTRSLEEAGDWPSLYTEDVFGGHFSPKGNQLIADLICERLGKGVAL